MILEQFLEQLQRAPDTLEFTDTMAVIEHHYDYTPTAFQNGDVSNAAGQNAGSCKLFAFAKLQGLSDTQTLACFGRYYREDVLQHPDAQDHQNIRNFMKTGWAGVKFEGNALTVK